MDIVIIVLLLLALHHAMDKHGTWKPLTGIGDYIGWFMVGMFALALVRLPIYFLIYGANFPFNASNMVQALTGIGAIVFWFSMAYWRIPMRVISYIKKS